MAIAVIGDIILDSYYRGNYKMIGAEEIPVVSTHEVIHQLGGAGKVANDIKTLGGDISLFGYIGDDDSGKIIRDLLIKKKIDFHSHFPTKTTHKSRINQILRFDEELIEPQKDNFSTIIRKDDYNIIIVSDYGKGCITQEVYNNLRSLEKKILVDPKNLDYSGAYLLKPNQFEVLELPEFKDVENLLVTKGKEGMTLHNKDGEKNYPSEAKEIYDVVGAGDTILSTIAVCLEERLSLEDSIKFANKAAGIVVSKHGQYSPTRDELGLDRITSFACGCFDFFHVGHLETLMKAEELGNYLIVGIASDRRARIEKGEGRPLFPLEDRMRLIQKYVNVDEFIVGEKGDYSEFINKTKPNFYVKGGDYNKDTINQNERKAVERYGGNIVFSDLIKCGHTTDMESEINGIYDNR